MTLLYFLPIAVWFSYFPQFHFGRGEGMNFEISISLIMAVIFAVVGFFENHKKIFENFKKYRALQLTFIWILWNFLSVIWAQNPVRAILTSGVWMVLWLDFAVIFSFKNLNKTLFSLKKIFIYSALIMSLLAILQIIYGAFTDWGLCRGCLAEGFGFVRPSVFAIEPQFFGSLLLAPILLVWSDFLRKGFSKKHALYLIVMLAAMWLTLSRGAIFSLIPAMFMVIFWIEGDSKFRKFLQMILFVAGGFFLGLNLHAVMAEANPRLNETYYGAISKSVNQMTLGKISLPKIPPEKIHNSVEKSVENPVENLGKKPHFDGYVEKSTDERTGLSELALKTWLRNPQTMIFGVGSGSGGRAIFETTRQTGWAFEIVQNEFLNILLENGIIGAAIWTAILVGFFAKTSSKKYLWAIALAFLLQWNFFSGLPNALHIYLILAVIFSKFYHQEFENLSKI